MCAPEPVDKAAQRFVLVSELFKLKKLGFLVVDEAFHLAREMALDECDSLPMSALAIVVSERGYAAFKSRLHVELAG